MTTEIAGAGFTDEEQEPPKRRIYRSDKGRFYHDAMALDLMDLRSARFIEGIPAIWDELEGRYRMRYAGWDAAIVDLCSGTTQQNRKEVASYLSIIGERHNQGDPHLIACANGVINPWVKDYDALDDEGHSVSFVFNTPENDIPNVLPVTWDPNAYDEATDKALDAFACGDAGTRLNLEEILAACIYRGREIQQMAVLVGDGGNGKSVYLDMLSKMLGPDNVTSIDLRDVGKRFMQAPLMGKLANIGDDIADGFIESAPLSIIRKVVTGNPITIEEKYHPPYDARPYATMVFSANVFPRIADSTQGMLDRFHAVRFAADFRHNPEARITNISELLDNDLSRSYLLNLALRRLPDLVRRGGFTPTPYSEAERGSLLLDNDSVAYWIDTNGITARYADGKTVEGLYREYADFCGSAGRKPVEQRTFTRRVNKRLGTRTAKDILDNSRQVRGFHMG